jgi:glycosyltransferase involved in cell wall biosynthesis
MPDHFDISIVIPLYNEEENITILYNKIETVLKSLNKIFEVIFVDDGSRDSSFAIVKSISSDNTNVRGISLSRNFGHQIALLAGMQHARGDLVITMDADLQHPPEAIPLLIGEYEKGYDIVNTRRIDSRETGYFKKTTSRLFYRMINRISEVPINESSSDFRLMSRRALDSFLQFGERDRFTRGLVSWMGFRQIIVDYVCPPRLAGQSKYTFRKMAHFAADGVTSFSAKPLRIASYVGIIVFILGLGYALFAIIQNVSGKTIPGWTSLLVTVLLLGGIQLLTLGVIGEYLARIFNESKSRPLYFIKDQTN